jgi:hypothetical protein
MLSFATDFWPLFWTIIGGAALLTALLSVLIATISPAAFRPRRRPELALAARLPAAPGQQGSLTRPVTVTGAAETGLLPTAANADLVDHVGGPVVGEVPGGVQDLGPDKHHAGVPEEQFEQGELLRGQVQLGATPPGKLAGRVQPQVRSHAVHAVEAADVVLACEQDQECGDRQRGPCDALHCPASLSSLSVRAPLAGARESSNSMITFGWDFRQGRSGGTLTALSPRSARR